MPRPPPAEPLAVSGLPPIQSYIHNHTIIQSTLYERCGECSSPSIVKSEKLLGLHRAIVPSRYRCCTAAPPKRIHPEGKMSEKHGTSCSKSRSWIALPNPETPSTLIFPNPCKITSHGHASPETSNLLGITDSLQPNCHHGPTGHGINQPVHQTAYRHEVFADDILHGRTCLMFSLSSSFLPIDSLPCPISDLFPSRRAASKSKLRKRPVSPRPLKIIPDCFHVANLLLYRWPLGLQGKLPGQNRLGKGVSAPDIEKFVVKNSLPQ